MSFPHQKKIVVIFVSKTSYIFTSPQLHWCLLLRKAHRILLCLLIFIDIFRSFCHRQNLSGTQRKWEVVNWSMIKLQRNFVKFIKVLLSAGFLVGVNTCRLMLNYWMLKSVFFACNYPCKIVDFAVPVDHRINLKECEKKDKYLDLARESKKLWNMKVTILPIVIGAFDTITKGLLKGLEDLKVDGQVETIQMTALLRTARILRRVLETWGDLQSFKLQWKTIG